MSDGPRKIGAAAPGTPPDATTPLSDHSRPCNEPGAVEFLATGDDCDFHESARISKSCHEIPTSPASAGACGREPSSTEHGAPPRGAVDPASSSRRYAEAPAAALLPAPARREFPKCRPAAVAMLISPMLFISSDPALPASRLCGAIDARPLRTHPFRPSL